MRIGSSSAPQTQSTQLKWECPDMDAAKIKDLLQRIAENPNALNGQQNDQELKASDKFTLDGKGNDISSLFFYNPRDDRFQKIVDELRKSAQSQNQKPESPMANINQDGFEAAAPQSAWKAFSGK